MIHDSLIATIAIVAGALAMLPPDAQTQSGRLEYRVIHAAPYQLQQVIDDAGRDGFTCVSVARPELDVRLPGVVVTLARPYIETTHVNPKVIHRVVRGSGSGGDFGVLLEKGAADGYRLCGLALADVSPGPVLVAVMSPDAAARVVAQPLGDHLGRDRSRDRARVVSSSVRSGPSDRLTLHTVLVQLPR